VSKPAIRFVLGAAAVVLAAVFGLLAHDGARRTRTAPAPSQTRESVTEPTQTVPTEAAREPTRPSPALGPTAVPRPRKPAEPPASERLDESSVIAKLHDLAASDPPQSLSLAREALSRFPDSRHAPELEWNVVKALANMDRYQEAEEEARRMLETYPDNPFSIDVEHHLLNHPPNPPGTH
jgi:hypothetical protein